MVLGMTVSPTSDRKPCRTVSCADNPQDLRPALDALEAEIIRRAPTPEKPLVVIMGEEHTMSVHHMLQQGLMARLLNTVSPLPIALGMEVPHNLLEIAAYDVLRYKRRPDMHEMLGTVDRDGRNFLRVMRAGFVRTPYAPVAFQNRMAFCQKYQVSVRGHDMAYVANHGSYCLNQKDPLTRAMVESRAPLLAGDQIDAESVRGISLRNQFMAARTIDHMRETGAAVYILTCGAYHVLGMRAGYLRPEFPSTESLMACFREAGVNAMPVVTRFRWHKDCDDTEFLSVEGFNTLCNQGLLIKGVSMQSHTASDPAGEELAFLREISKNSGGRIELFPPYGWLERFQERYRIKREIPKWIAQAQAAGKTYAP